MNSSEDEINTDKWPTMSLDGLVRQLTILQTRQYSLLEINKGDLARSLQPGIDTLTALIKTKYKGAL